MLSSLLRFPGEWSNYTFDKYIVNDPWILKRFPLIIHLENHCSIAQQKLVAGLLKEHFGTALLIAPQPDLITKSPEELAGKIIISVGSWL